MSESENWTERMEAVMARVEAMKSGGDLEALLEEESRDWKKALFQEAIGRRQASGPADFSPSGVPALPGADHAPDRGEPAHGPDARG